MKITTKVMHNVELELTPAQLEAFDEVSEVITSLYDELFEQTNEVWNNDSGEVISLQRIADAAEVLGNLAGASGFTFLEERG